MQVEMGESLDAQRPASLSDAAVMYSNKVARTPLYSHKAHRDIHANNSKLREELFTIKGKSTCILNLQKDLVKARSFLTMSHRSFRGSQESQRSATALAEGKLLTMGKAYPLQGRQI